MDTEERSRNLDNMSSEISDEMRLLDALEMDNLCKKSTTEARDNDVTGSGLLTLGSLKKVELGENCILVDYSELECRYAEAAKGRSSRKVKLKDAFASKMRLLKKHNNDEQKNSFSMLPLPEKLNSPDYEFCQSDWEIA